MTKSKTRKPARKKVGEKTLEHYIGLLRDGDNFEKEKAIDALTASPGKDAVEGIIPLLQQKNTGARMAVLDVMKKI
jgi:HEAT repeat protein